MRWFAESEEALRLNRYLKQTKGSNPYIICRKRKEQVQDLALKFGWIIL